MSISGGSVLQYAIPHCISNISWNLYIFHHHIDCDSEQKNSIDFFENGSWEIQGEFGTKNGREWKNDRDKKIAEQIQSEVVNRDKSLAKQEARINAKIDNINNNAKLSDDKRSQQIATQQNKLEAVKTERNIISTLDKGITQLGASKTVYTFNTVESGITATLSSQKDGTVIINNYGTLGNRSHETSHAIQYDNHLITFNPLGSNNLLMRNPLGIEIQAYGTEYSITGGIVPLSDNGTPKSIFGITPNWLYGLKDSSGTYLYRPSNYK